MKQKRTKSQSIVDNFGLMWARNPKSLAALPERKAGGEGVYMLYDGSMPVYAGTGGFRRRIGYAEKTHKRAQAWTHFSWFAIKDRTKHYDLENFRPAKHDTGLTLQAPIRSAGLENFIFACAKWRAQGGDFRTFIDQFVACLPHPDILEGLSMTR
jgi:hypothetical protein